MPFRVPPASTVRTERQIVKSAPLDITQHLKGRMCAKHALREHFQVCWVQLTLTCARSALPGRAQTLDPVNALLA